MEPLFDQNCDLLGWIDPGKHIFDTEMNWVAYLSDGHAWSAITGNWLGPVNGLNCLDQEGKPIAWNPSQPVEGSIPPIRPIRAIRAIRPIRPIKPIRPIRPIMPITPLEGWSQMSWHEWLSQ